MLRRKSAYDLRLERENIGDFHAINGIMNYWGDLTQNEIIHAFKFHDNDRGGAAVSFGRFSVEFKYQDQLFSLNTEEKKIEKD